MGFLKSKNRPTNLQNDWVNSLYKPQAEQLGALGSQGLQSFMGALTGADNGAGFDQFRRSTGYQNMLQEALRGVSGSSAARGLLASGSTARALQDRAGQMAQGTYSNYLQQLLQGSQLGLQGGVQAGNLVAEVGAQRQRRGGLGSFFNTVGQIGQAAGALASLSDARLKENIERIDTRPDGLNVYRFNYVGEDEPQIGVLAHEVAEIRPDALGPIVQGYLTVDYAKLDDDNG